MIQPEHETRTTEPGLLEVTKVGGKIGAEVSGLTIGDNIGPADVDEFRAAPSSTGSSACAGRSRRPTPTSARSGPPAR